MSQYHITPHVPHFIVKDSRHSDGWITGVINGRFFEAKVYDEPSEFGINEGRVSKLALGKTSLRDKNKNYFDQVAYNYDRGDDYSEIDEKELNKIVAWFEKLPKVFE